MRRSVDRIRPRHGPALAYATLDSGVAGRTVLITANVHGDELTGLVAAQRLDALLVERLVRGRVVIYYSLNPGGLESRKRVLPEDGADLNRMFPGDEASSVPSEQRAGRLWRSFLRHRPDALIDLHADSIASIPYAIIDRAVRQVGPRRAEMVEALTALGRATGLTILREYPEDEYLRFGLDRSLAGAMVNHAGVPAVTIEAGPRRTVDLRSVEVAVDAVMRALGHLDLVEEVPAPDPSRRVGAVWRRASAPRTTRAGIFVPALRPGDRFRAGDLLGSIHAVDGERLESIEAPLAGIVVSWSDGGWLEARGIVGTLGLEEHP